MRYVKMKILFKLLYHTAPYLSVVFRFRFFIWDTRYNYVVILTDSHYLWTQMLMEKMENIIIDYSTVKKRLFNIIQENMVI